MKKKLDANWNVSSGFSQKIFAQVAFVINKNGSITGVEIEQTSHNEIFDRAALRAVEYANPLPPLPADFPEPSLRVHVRFSVKR
jgi:TonB family protein